VLRLLDPLDRTRHELSYWQSRAISAIADKISKSRKRRLYARWLRTLETAPPDVLIGANIDRHGGIRQHLLGIQKYSSLRVAFSPPDELTGALTYHDLRTVLFDQLMEFDPNAIRAIHSHVYPYFIEWCAARKRKEFRWIHTYHSFYHAAAEGGQLLPWQEEINDVLIRVARNADVRISVSRWQQQYLKTAFGIECIYVPNGVDVELCDSADPDRFWQGDVSAPFVLFVGRDEPVKNPADFVKLASRVPGLRFVMIGSGLDHTSKSEWTVGLPPNIELRGRQTRVAVQDAIAACSVVVVTSALEGLPTIVLEAMTHGKPIVVPNVPGCMEPVTGHSFGFVYCANDIEDLMRKTQLALSGDPHYPLARDIVLAEYDWRVVGRRLDAVYTGEQI
jgi:glycosyltransferase involved in cell wall biosynthesis